MAANESIIGRTTRVRGRVTGAVDLLVLGFVDGEIAVSGDVTVDGHGLVGASVQGRRLVVRGAVKGDLLGEEAVVLEDGARVVGDVRAPRVAIAAGALVRGYVETGEGNGAPARASRGEAAARPATHAARPAAAPARVAPPPKPGGKLAPAVHVAGGGGSANNSGHSRAAARRPPPPVVPALKKAKGQIAKKKER
jgi:cytoskeletal protein CcmA (bactofilin family)